MVQGIDLSQIMKAGGDINGDLSWGDGEEEF